MPPRVFITGASSGLGLALTQHYARLDAQLGLFARRQESLQTLAADIAPGRCLIYRGDVTSASSCAQAAGHFIGQWGAPDIVIANAGISVGTLTEDRRDLEVFQSIFATNVMGVVNTFSPFIGPMRSAAEAGRRPILVGMASIAGYRGLPGAAAYSASKAALISYLESLRVELRGAGICVATVCPGYIATPMTEKNPYRMPFMLTAGRAADLIAGAIQRRQGFYVVPWQMAVAARVLKLLPNWMFDRLFMHAPRKPRRTRS